MQEEEARWDRVPRGSVPERELRRQRAAGTLPGPANLWFDVLPGGPGLWDERGVSARNLLQWGCDLWSAHDCWAFVLRPAASGVLLL